MTINRSFAASGEDGDSSVLAPLDSASLLPPRSRPHTSAGGIKRPGRVHRAKSASNILDGGDDFQRRLYDPVLAPHLQRRPPKQDGFADLVDFLRNHAPPPGNFMSTPDHSADEERGRWLRWTKIAKRSKSAPRGPPQIRLPDSAVSGKTIGGHRHIAITIPFEAFPMGERPRTQYPVYFEDSRSSAPGSNPVRTVVNDKGVVTVLKTVNEDREGSDSSRRATSHSYMNSGPLPRTPSRRGRASIQGYLSAPPSRGSASLRSGDNGLVREAPRAQPVSAPYPRRVSSVGNRSLHRHMSIDGMLLQPGPAGEGPSLSQFEGQGQTESGPSSINGWPFKEKKAVTVKPSRIAVDGSPMEEDENVSKESGATILKDNPLGSRTDDSGPPTPSSAHNRRDRVRDRKRRDMEALRNAKLEQHDATDVRLLFSPIRVVMNVEPCPLPAEAPLTPSQTDPASQPEHPADAQDKVIAGMPPAINGSNPTPPLSPDNSPPKKQCALDRTSLSRRREWRATREQERKSKEARAAVRARAKQLAAGGVDELSESPQSLDTEILRLYEAYRDHRFRDMERRVRRLERNGDVWLRALVPVLDNLNRTMLCSSQEGLNEREYMSDGGPAAATRQSHRHKAVPVRRANSSHKTIREEELKQMAWEEENEVGPQDGSRRGSAGNDSVAGLETIEPLMRELAGAARRRQMMTGGFLRAY